MTRFFLITAASTALLCSCETTGDPGQGGLFGWSQNKADQRVASKQQQLYDIQQDTAAQQARSGRLESELKQKQSY